MTEPQQAVQLPGTPDQPKPGPPPTQWTVPNKLINGMNIFPMTSAEVKNSHLDLYIDKDVVYIQSGIGHMVNIG